MSDAQIVRTEAEQDQGSRKMPQAVRAGLIKVQGGSLYLKAPHRILWMREDHPDWEIKTQIVEGGYEAGFVVMKATICNEQGRVLATAHKEEQKGKFPFLSKAETGAIARALAIVGYGTQFGEINDDDTDSVADAPLQRTRSNLRVETHQRPYDTDANGEIHNLPTRPPLSQAQQQARQAKEAPTYPPAPTTLAEAKLQFRHAAGAVAPILGAPQTLQGTLDNMMREICEDGAPVEKVAARIDCWTYATDVLRAFKERLPEATPETILIGMQAQYQTDMPMTKWTAGMWEGLFAE